MKKEDIIARLPYGEIFLFVDTIMEVSERGITGTYTFREDEYFYGSHFRNFAVTPGVILTECMAQIGLVCFGIYLFENNHSEKAVNSDFQMALSSTDVEFLKPVFPKETVTVTSELVYFRFNKLKCKVKMTNSNGELVVNGILSGMVINRHLTDF